MKEISEKIEFYYAEHKRGVKRSDAVDYFNEAMDLLESGLVRCAFYNAESGSWQSTPWVKKAILLGFMLGNVKSYNSGSDIVFQDKDTFPLRKKVSGVRFTPPASGIRRGAYAAPGSVFMSPAFANVGSYIGENSMVEGLAGSCSQIGASCHLSAGSVVGGVLDPVEATPVIIGDYVLLGAGATVTQGAQLENLVTLAPGVHVSKATPVFDIVNNKTYTKDGVHTLDSIDLNGVLVAKQGKLLEKKDNSFGPVIPSGALVIPGMSVGSSGYLKVAPTIVKYISSVNERAYALEECLR